MGTAADGGMLTERCKDRQDTLNGQGGDDLLLERTAPLYSYLHGKGSN